MFDKNFSASRLEITNRLAALVVVVAAATVAAATDELLPLIIIISRAPPLHCLSINALVYSRGDS